MPSRATDRPRSSAIHRRLTLACAWLAACASADVDTLDPPTELPEEVCTSPADPGDCDASLTRYAYDAAAGRCVAFVYGGCAGNANNFPTRAHCEAQCRPNRAPCTHTDACARTDFCAFTDAACGHSGARGRCSPRPARCPPPSDTPVCGCDARTYPSACEAERAGVDAWHEGPCLARCDPGPPTIVLGGGFEPDPAARCGPPCYADLELVNEPVGAPDACRGVTALLCDAAIERCAEHRGFLTEAGYRAAVRHAEGLDGVSLPAPASEPRAWVTLRRRRVESVHPAYEPPLRPSTDLVEHLILALATCRDTPLVRPSEDCRPYRR